MIFFGSVGILLLGQEKWTARATLPQPSFHSQRQDANARILRLHALRSYERRFHQAAEMPEVRLRGGCRRDARDRSAPGEDARERSRRYPERPRTPSVARPASGNSCGAWCKFFLRRVVT